MGAEVSQGLVGLDGVAARRRCAHRRSQPQSEGAALVARVRRRCAIALVSANALGGAIVFVLGLFVVPAPHVPDAAHLHFLNVIGFAIALPLLLGAGAIWSYRSSRHASAWVLEERDPTPEERIASLRYPLQQTYIEAVMWAAAAIGFTVLNAPYSVELAVESAVEIVLGGLTTCAVTYLLAERIAQPVTGRALASGVPDNAPAPGVACRMMLAWGFGSAVPLLALALLGVAMIAHAPVAHGGGLAVLLLAAVGVVAGLVTVWITSRMVSDPLRSLRTALAEVERGELATVLTVHDASEVGQVQAGFNRMVRGLRERDRLRDLFGRHVGEEVARDALERGDVALGGETREAAVMFVDLIGSTRLASSRDPADVVAELNAFFAIVVDCVSLHGGWVNKFEGDAALCVFGAPTAHPDAAGSALATARALSSRLRRELAGVDAGIGVSAGPVVAGNVGAAERFEYTVIGDPVNEAARLTELAKAEPGRVLASEAAVRRARQPERERWSVGRCVTLRGRPEPTTVAIPRHGPVPAEAARPAPLSRAAPA